MYLLSVLELCVAKDAAKVILANVRRQIKSVWLEEVGCME